MTLISIEGNIGSGKEEFIQFFKKYFTDDIIFIEDNVYNWKDKSLLSNFYRDPHRWAFTLQVHSISQKYKRFVQVLPYKKKGSVMITHRSPMSDNFCFQKSCVESGYIDSKEDDIYQSVFENYRIPKFHGVIYLHSNVNKCYENIITKDINVEKSINFDFLMNIHNNYESWIGKIKKENIPVVEIQTDDFMDLDINEMVQRKLYDTIVNSFPDLLNFSK
jgi:deoxyadenosine/deoxycytidine kinase